MDPRLAITICNALAHVAVLWRLVSASLLRKYPWFSVLVAVAFLQSFGWALGPPESHGYRYFWLYTTPLLLGLRVLAVVELWRLLISRNPHVRALYPVLMPTIAVIAVTTSVASGVDLWGFGYTVRAMSLAIRFSASILAVVTVLLALFGRIFSEPLPRNTVRHALILSGYFTSLAIGHLLLHITAAHAGLIGAAMVGAEAAFFVLWAVLITPDGEVSPEWAIPTNAEIGALDLREARLSPAGFAAIPGIKSAGR
jgi:hypothetical protein